MNIIYILLDQVRKDMLGAYGHQIVKTPNIDRLAKDGVRFNNAFTPASVCGPARTSLFTCHPHMALFVMVKKAVPVK